MKKLFASMLIILLNYLFVFAQNDIKPSLPDQYQPKSMLLKKRIIISDRNDSVKPTGKREGIDTNEINKYFERELHIEDIDRSLEDLDKLAFFDTIYGKSESDTIRIKISGKTILIIQDGDKTNNIDSVIIDNDKDDGKKDKDENKNKVWGGFELGFNGYLNAEKTAEIPDNFKFLELKQGKSISFAFNLPEMNVPVIQEYVKIGTGLGFEWNNYRFINNTRLIDSRDSLSGLIDTTQDYTKTKLRVSYLNAPLLLEFNTGKNNKKSFHIAGGLLLGYKLGATTKLVYARNGREYTDKSKGDYQLSDFRYGLTARVGYGNFRVFANYSLNPLFLKGRGPELYPFTLGLSIIPF